MKAGCLSIFCYLIASLSCAQNGTPSAEMADLSLTAAGRQHHPIQTQSKEAQEYFDQKITLLYGFKLARNYAKAMRLLSQKYPDDPDAARLYAESLMDLNP